MSLENAPTDKVFWLKGGTPLKNLHDLAEQLRGMDDETFSHHVNGSKNDFAAWVRHVLGDETLARKLALLSDREDAEHVVIARINELEKPAEQKSAIPQLRLTMPKERTQKKTIINTGNTTPLSVSTVPERVVSESKTHLKLVHHHERIITPHVSTLRLAHEDERPQHNITYLVTMNVILGVVVGVAITVLVFSLL